MDGQYVFEELKPEKMDLIQLIRIFKREGIENFITIRREKFETLISENKELKEENQIMALEASRVSLELYIKENYIPKSKIEEKIEELEKEKSECIIFKNSDIKNYCNECKENCSYNDSIKILKELLEE